MILVIEARMSVSYFLLYDGLFSAEKKRFTNGLLLSLASFGCLFFALRWISNLFYTEIADEYKFTAEALLCMLEIIPLETKKKERGKHKTE